MRQKSLDKRVQSERRRQVRKEKSKEAARSRRGKEGEVFTDIIDTLPVTETVKAALDKTSIIRLCINYIKARGLLDNVLPVAANGEVQYTDLGPAVEETVDVLHGFVLMLSASFEVVYVTANIKQLLGICEYDVIGHNLDMFIHPADWEESEQHLKSSNASLGFSVRFKSHLSSRSRGTNFKSSSYKTVKFSGRRVTADVKPGEGAIGQCLVLTATPIEHPSHCKLPLDSMTFTSKHSPDMRFIGCDSHAKELTRYQERYMVGKSFYDFVHPSDIKAIVANFKALSSKEQVITDPYMFLTNGGGYVKVTTQASLVTDSKTSKVLNILCVHRVISEPVSHGVVMADIQMADGLAVVKTEKTIHEHCGDSMKPPRVIDETITQRSSKRPEDEFVFDIETTASVFMAPDEEDDMMRVTESIFGDDDGDTTFGNVGCKAGKTALEAVLEELDKDTVDSGLFVDYSDKTSDKDFHLRAPYIPMEDYSDMPLIQGWCYDERNSPCSSSKPDNWSYRQEETNTSNLASPVPSYSPEVTADSSSSSSSPAANSPWQQDSTDLTSDLEQLSYDERDHDSYVKSVETTLSSLANMKSSFNDRIPFTNSDLQHSPQSRESWSSGSYSVYERSPAADLPRVPSSTSQVYDSPDPQQHGYARRKRKAENEFRREQTPLKGQVDPVLEAAYKRTQQTTNNRHNLPSTAITQTNAPSQHRSSYVSSTEPVRGYSGNPWAEWEGAAKRSNRLPSTPISVKVDKPQIGPSIVKLSSHYSTGWLATSAPSHVSTQQANKYTPTLQKRSPTSRDRDKKLLGNSRVAKAPVDTEAVEKAADSLLLGLLQQQT